MLKASCVSIKGEMVHVTVSLSLLPYRHHLSIQEVTDNRRLEGAMKDMQVTCT